MTEIAVVVLGPAGLETARRIKAALPGARLHGPARRLAGGVDVPFDDTAAHVQRLFQKGTTIIGVCAAGILIRLLAPVLGDKQAEPPVLAASADGASVVPLLGGHRGANALALRLAQALGGHAAVTTASDTAIEVALDEPPPGWRLANPEAAKAVTAALLAGEPVRLEVEAGHAAWLGDRFSDEGRLMVRVTDRATPPADSEFVLHPPVLALGLGCERDADPDEALALARRTLESHGLSPQAVACVASLDLKADEPAVHAVAEALGVPARFFTASELEAQADRLATPSEVVFREVGCHGVAEGAALAAAGPDAVLAVPKAKSARATCAIARAPADIHPRAVGRARGRLFVVGIGPGTAAWRTPEATRALAEAEEVVGYGLYLDLVADLIAGKTRHDSPLGEETERARLALERAAEGRTVALVCSGDPGIYALATLVFELMESEQRPEWNRVAVTVVPGVSALQAAAARAGAPLGHDFCAVSLSDLLTPWEVIERRLTAAAEGDFVVALYNPVSKRRRTHLANAREILAAHRPADTPVVVARNLGRDGETVTITTLAELDPERVDMLSIVLIGNGDTRAAMVGRRAWIYTPRGYARKQNDNHRDTETQR